MFVHTLILCPTAAGAREARRKFLAETAGGRRDAFLGTAALTKDEFVRDAFLWMYPDERILNTSERMALAGRVASEGARAGGTAYGAIAGHPGFWRNLLSFFDECREGMVSPDRLAGLMSDSKIHPARSEHLCFLFRNYLKALAAAGAVDRVAAEERILAELPKHWPDIPFLSGTTRAVIQGFTDIRPLFFEEILALSRLVEVQVLLPVPPQQKRANRWLTDLYERFESLGENTEGSKLDSHLSVDWSDDRPLRPLLTRLFLSPIALQEEAKAKKITHEWISPDLPLKILRTADVREEWKSAARCIRRLLDAGIAPERIALLRRSAAQTDEFLKVFNDFSIPVDLAEEDESPESADAVRRILSIYRLIDSNFAREEILAFASRPPWELPRSLRHPDLGFDLRQARVLQGLKDIPGQLESQAKFVDRRNPVQARRLKALAKDLPEVFGEISRLDVSRPATEHLSALWDLLEKNSFLAEEETGRWLEDRRSVLERVFDGWADPLSCESFARILEAALGDRPCPKRPGGGVAVLRLEDMPAVPVDYLFVLGMNAGVFPREPVQEVLLKDAERAAVNKTSRGALLTAERERLRENFLFFLALLSVRKQAVLSVPARDAEGELRAPSVYIDDILLHVKPEDRPRMYLATPSDPPAPDEIEAAAVAEAFEGSTSVTGVPDPDRFRSLVRRADIERRRLAFFRQRRAAGRRKFAFEYTGRLEGPLRFEKSLSITALEEFARCPFRGFTRHVLHIPETERPRETISAADLGSLLHAAVCEWWKYVLNSHPARPSNGGEAAAVIREARSNLPRILAETAKKYLPRGAAGPLWMAQLRLIERAVESLVELDLRETQAGWWPEALEEPLTLDLPEGWKSHGRLDRLDRHDHGTFRVIDYKSADAKSLQTKKSKQGVSEIQMPAYAMALRQKFGHDAAVELFYYSLRHRAQPVDILKTRKDAPLLDALNLLMGAFRVRMAELIEELSSGQCDVTPSDPDLCSTCMCRTSCRTLAGVVVEQDGPDAEGEDA